MRRFKYLYNLLLETWDIYFVFDESSIATFIVMEIEIKIKIKRYVHQMVKNACCCCWWWWRLRRLCIVWVSRLHLARQKYKMCIQIVRSFVSAISFTVIEIHSFKKEKNKQTNSIQTLQNTQRSIARARSFACWLASSKDRIYKKMKINEYEVNY